MRSTETASDEFRPLWVPADKNLADLVTRIVPEDRPLYESLRYVYTEAAFYDRRFVIVRTTGRNARGPNQPDILGSFVVTGFRCDHERGSTIFVKDEASSQSLQVGHVPLRLWRFPAFLSVPIYQGVKWEAKEMQNGTYLRRLVFGICVKQQSNVKFYNKDNVAVLTPNEYKTHFGDTLPRF